VIFGEAGLVSADAKLEKRTRLIRYGIFGGAALGVVLMLLSWAFTYFKTRADRRGRGQVADYNAKAKGVCRSSASPAPTQARLAAPRHLR